MTHVHRRGLRFFRTVQYITRRATRREHTLDATYTCDVTFVTRDIFCHTVQYVLQYYCTCQRYPDNAEANLNAAYVPPALRINSAGGPNSVTRPRSNDITTSKSAMDAMRCAAAITAGRDVVDFVFDFDFLYEPFGCDVTYFLTAAMMRCSVSVSSEAEGSSKSKSAGRRSNARARPILAAWPPLNPTPDVLHIEVERASEVSRHDHDHHRET